MARPLSHRVMSFAGRALVVAILGFIILPAFVVAVASFNEKALLSFPPQQLSLRWFYNAINYKDFQSGFYNGLIMMLASSFLALFVGAAFAYVIDRYEFRGKNVIEGLLLAPLVVPHFTVGLGMLILAAQIGAARTFSLVIVCHVVLVLPFVLRSVYISLRNLDQRLELAAASLGAKPGRVLATVTLPLLMPDYRRQRSRCLRTPDHFGYRSPQKRENIAFLFE